MTDNRNLATGWRLPLPAGHYSDQPYIVVNADGTWTCVVTTGAGEEGAAGQHVVSLISSDAGRSWQGPFDIEPADGPESSWAMPLRVEETGRIYVFYTYNAENRREVATVDGRAFTRVDSFGSYAYKYSDDGGRTWSPRRYEIPMRLFQCDRDNVYQGRVLFFWGVGKPFVHRGAAYVCASKVGGFGEGFFVQNEGVLFRSPNLTTEHDPARHTWETLPEGDIGLRAPEGGGPIAGEFKAVPMNNGWLYGTYRTVAGFSCQAVSRDDGRTWECDWMRYEPGGRRVKNPRAANFAWKTSDGRYLYWYEFHGGEALGRGVREGRHNPYDQRNPAWLCGGIERDGVIYWSQPEIALYDDDPGARTSYPDFVEQDGHYYLSETRKDDARVHELDPALLAALWSDPARSAAVARQGLVLEHSGGGSLAMPSLPTLHNRGASRLDPDTGATLPGEARQVTARGGFTLELWVRFTSCEPWQVLFDSRDEEGLGLLVMLTDRQTIQLRMTGRTFARPGAVTCGPITESAWECDGDLLRADVLHHVVFIVDGGPKIVSVLVDGTLCDGGPQRQYGWGRFHPHLRDVNGAATARVAPTLQGQLHRLRCYDRYLLTGEAVANFKAGPDAVAADVAPQ